MGRTVCAAPPPRRTGADAPRRPRRPRGRWRAPRWVAGAGARGRGVLVSGLREYWAGGDGAGAPGRRGAASYPGEGLVLGLTARDEDLARGTRVLRDVLGG